jgi:hypothetical protein
MVNGQAEGKRLTVAGDEADERLVQRWPMLMWTGGCWYGQAATVNYQMMRIHLWLMGINQWEH